MNLKCYKSVNSDLGKLWDQARWSGSRNGMDPFLYFGFCLAVTGVAFDSSQPKPVEGFASSRKLIVCPTLTVNWLDSLRRRTATARQRGGRQS
jgi:hypothetical protein